MGADLLVLIEVLVIFGAVMLFGWWQLRGLKKREREDEDDRERKG